MDTNRSRFNDIDLRRMREELDAGLPANRARKKNREERKAVARRTRHREKHAFDEMIRRGDLDGASFFLEG